MKRKKSLLELIKHLYIYTSNEDFKYYDYYNGPCIEEIYYDEVYHNNEYNMTIEVYKKYDFINIIGLTSQELEMVENMLHIHIYFKGGE